MESLDLLGVDIASTCFILNGLLWASDQFFDGNVQHLRQRS